MGLSIGFRVRMRERVRMVGDGGRGVCGAGVAVGVVEDGGAEVGHCAGGPPGIAEAVEEVHALA